MTDGQAGVHVLFLQRSRKSEVTFQNKGLRNEEALYAEKCNHLRALSSAQRQGDGQGAQ